MEGKAYVVAMVDYRWATPVCAGDWLTKLVLLLVVWEDTEKLLQGTSGQNYDVTLKCYIYQHCLSCFSTVMIFGC